jgi:hypothetical protein
MVIQLRPATRTSDLLGFLEQEHARVDHFRLEEEHDRRIVTVTLDTPSEQLLTLIADLEFVLGVEWSR